MTNINSDAIFKMHQIEIKPDTNDEYLNANRGDMITAVAIEDGTFGMYASHDPQDLTKNYIFEVFDDQEAYEAHKNSAQYHQFRQEIDGIITSDKETYMEPQFMAHQNVALNISTPNDLWVNVVRIKLKDGHFDDYKEAVSKQLQTAIDTDDSFLAIYAGNIKGTPNDWIVYEVFQSEEDYRNHTAGQYYKDYVEKTKDWIEEKHISQSIGDILVNQGNN
ncbi:MAG: antibiotic biosynthesis monooxygenase family protein [Limosilactobacillus sp.]|uniref:putative quinol monooxygenase n=1 Tax=Limosilactobacillus sp. TaxID=2773925 RepID=UPI0026FD7265|nr:antibiotic biosynthesis monooxygenase family protein [Limosilactobacillus sp.]